MTADHYWVKKTAIAAMRVATQEGAGGYATPEQQRVVRYLAECNDLRTRCEQAEARVAELLEILHEWVQPDVANQPLSSDERRASMRRRADARARARTLLRDTEGGSDG